MVTVVEDAVVAVAVAVAVVEDTGLMVEEEAVKDVVVMVVVVVVAVAVVDTDMTTNSTRRLTSSLTNIPNIVIVSSYVPTQSYDDED